MIEKLTKEHGFVNLDVNSLITREKERRTDIGLSLLHQAKQGKKLQTDIIVNMLKKIIYSGQDSRNKFILSSFPETIEHSHEFERCCSHISAIIYVTKKDPIVEVKDNNLQNFNIDALFQKHYKLRVIDEWNYRTFQEKLGNKVDYGVVHGRTLSGKSEVCK
jgi:adenylate kinase family enzyme